MRIGRSSFRRFAECDVGELIAMHGAPLELRGTRPSVNEVQTAWKKEQQIVRAVLRRWDAIRDREPSQDAIRLRDAKRDASRGAKRLLTDWRTAEEKERALLAQEVNEQLARVATMRLYSTLDHLRPVSKAGWLGVVWLQLAASISGESPERECRWCKDAFEPKRADARFCSAACKLKAHRAERKVRAR